jgi:hypothetical protein
MDHSIANTGRIGFFVKPLPPFFAGGVVLSLENGDWEASRC